MRPNHEATEQARARHGRGVTRLNLLFGMAKRRVKGKTAPPPSRVADVLLAIAERKDRKHHGRVARPDLEPQDGWNRAIRRANGDRGDRRHGNHPWNTRAVPRGRR